jgi:hypothetical protein
MMHHLKHKMRVLITAATMLAMLFTASSPMLASALPLNTVAWGQIKCASNEIVVDGHSCCPKSVATSPTKDKDSKGNPLTDESGNVIRVENKPASCLFAKYVNPFLALLSAAVGIVVVISIISGAIQFTASAGDPQKAANAKNRIRNALLGLLAYLLLYAFLQFIIPGGKFNA